jgi:hypothetical protein
MNHLREYWARRGEPGNKKLGDLGSFRERPRGFPSAFSAACLCNAGDEQALWLWRFATRDHSVANFVLLHTDASKRKLHAPLKRKLQFSVLASPNDLDRLTGIQNAL